MKILYAAYRHSPSNIDLASSADYFFYHALQDIGAEIAILGPFQNRPVLPEEAFRRIYTKITKKKYAKFPLSLAWHTSQALNRFEEQYKPDAVFTMFPPLLVFYRGKAPCVYRLDTCFLGWQRQYPQFGKLGLAISLWEEKRVFMKCAQVITHSEWTRNILIQDYGVASEKIAVFANPAAIPAESIPKTIDIGQWKQLKCPIRLLTVGRSYHHLKGFDIAIEIVAMLNDRGVPAELTIIGDGEKSIPFTRYIGRFQKSVPEQLTQYLELYQQAHFLLHPARFEGAGIVPSEAAAFGTPTLTNAIGGLATTVLDGVSGIVLPALSPAEAYVEAVIGLIKNPERYYALCASTRKRYETELNWAVAGKQLGDIFHKVVSQYPRSSP